MVEFDPSMLSKPQQKSGYDESVLNSSFIIVAITTLATWVVIASQAWAFFPDPVNSGNTLRGIELALSTVAWVLLAVGPIAVLTAFRAGDDFVLKYLPVVALAWPLSVLVIHLTLRLQAGAWYFDYLWNYPAFLVTDVVAPVVYLWTWRRLESWRKK